MLLCCLIFEGCEEVEHNVQEHNHINDHFQKIVLFVDHHVEGDDVRAQEHTHD
jgi:hypothetical protein